MALACGRPKGRLSGTCTRLRYELSGQCRRLRGAHTSTPVNSTSPSQTLTCVEMPQIQHEDNLASVAAVENVRPIQDHVITQQLRTPASPVVNLSPETWDACVSQGDGGLVLVDFYTDWCGPCKLMHKEVEHLARAFPRGVTFAKFNCGQHEEFSTRQRIRSLPTFRLYRRGRCIEQVTGAKPAALRQLLALHYRPQPKQP